MRVRVRAAAAAVEGGGGRDEGHRGPRGRIGVELGGGGGGNISLRSGDSKLI